MVGRERLELGVSTKHPFIVGSEGATTRFLSTFGKLQHMLQKVFGGF